MTDQRKAVPLLVCSETIRNAILKGDRLAAGLAFGLGALAKCKGIAPESAQQSPVAPGDDALKQAYVREHGSDAGWLGIEGSYFISGWQANDRARIAGAAAVSAADEQPRYNYGADGKGPVSLLNGDRLRNLLRDHRNAAPADERAAFEAWALTQPAHIVKDLGRRRDNDDYAHATSSVAWHIWQARARLAESPTVSATVPGAINAILRDLAEHALQVNDHTPKSFNSGVMALADRARKALNAAPTPPTSAPADAWMTDDGRVCNAASRDGMHKVTQASYCIPLFKGAPPTSAADAERLDALEAFEGKDQWVVAKGIDGFTVYLKPRHHATRSTLREAIDAAIAGSKGTK